MFTSGAATDACAGAVESDIDTVSDTATLAEPATLAELATLNAATATPPEPPEEFDAGLSGLVARAGGRGSATCRGGGAISINLKHTTASTAPPTISQRHQLVLFNCLDLTHTTPERQYEPRT